VRIYKQILLGVLALGMTAPGFAQSWDNSGNGLLNGTYYFRQVVWILSNDGAGDLGDALTLYNTITFDGNGNYTITNATLYDADANTLQTFSESGTYSIAASGYGFIQSPASQFIAEDYSTTFSTPEIVYGLVSNGIFMGSATETANFYNDFFVAAPASGATKSTFSGAYAIAGMDSPSGTVDDVVDYAILGTADGNGNFNTSKTTGYIAAAGGSGTTQSIGDANYTFSNGAANINFNNNIDNVGETALVAGSHYMYISPDGNFVFGGEPEGWDFFVGVRTGSSTTYSGLYYQAGMDVNEAFLAEDGAGFQDSYFGSFKAESVAHQRLNSFGNTDTDGNVIPEDFTYTDDVTISGNAGDDGIQHYFYSSNGQYRVGVGYYPGLGFSAAIQGPTFSNSGLAIDPTGLVNTGSNTLFTSRIAPGELLTLYGQSGSTLANGAAESSNLTLSSTLDNTQVSVNSVLAPVLAVNECGSYPCVTFVVPYETNSPGIADIQVLNGNNSSNTISAFVGFTAPGLFLLPQLNLGSNNMYYSATIHANGEVVSPSNPAQVGETVAVFLTGIGLVTPTVADGDPGPSNPTSSPVNSFAVNLSSTNTAGAQEVQATTTYVGLAPAEVAGLAQINLTIPSTVNSGDNVLEVVGPDSDTFMALISVGSSAAAPAIRSDATHMTARAIRGAAHPKHAPMGKKAKMHRQAPVAQ
jgi:uncharacterized protein (TIGR03437 family)